MYFLLKERKSRESIGSPIIPELVSNIEKTEAVHCRQWLLLFLPFRKLHQTFERRCRRKDKQYRKLFFKHALTAPAAKQIISQQQQDENNQNPQHFIGQKNHNCHSHCNPKQNKAYEPSHATTRKTHILLFNICALSEKILFVRHFPIFIRPEHSAALPVPLQPLLLLLFLPSSVPFLNFCW